MELRSVLDISVPMQLILPVPRGVGHTPRAPEFPLTMKSACPDPELVGDIFTINPSGMNTEVHVVFTSIMAT
jgi:hypothetical protein